MRTFYQRKTHPCSPDINKIRDPSSPWGLWLGQEEGSWEGAPALLSLPALGMERLKGLLLPPQDKDPPPQLFPPHPACPDNCARTTSQNLKLPPLWSFQNAPKWVLAVCCFLVKTTGSLLSTLHSSGLGGSFTLLLTEKFSKALWLCPWTVYPIYPVGDIQKKQEKKKRAWKN